MSDMTPMDIFTHPFVVAVITYLSFRLIGWIADTLVDAVDFMTRHEK